jgi:O-antigen ligase
MQHFTSSGISFSRRASREGVFVVALWLLVCLTCCLDTRQFVYLSLSQTLVSEVFVLLLGVVAVCHSWRKRKPLMLSRVQYAALAWGLYLLAHSFFEPQTEYYKLTYMEITLTLLFSLPYLLRTGLLTQKAVERGWLLMLAVQLVMLLLQARGTVSSYNSFFPLTGINENPNVTAILLVMVVPLLWERVKGKKLRVMYVILLAVTLLFVVLLKCRTAYVGLAVMVLVEVASHEKVQGWWRQRTMFQRTGMESGLVLVLLLSGFGLYQMKQDSADGRRLVWKVSAEMVREHPLGIGTGMFEHDYNLQQGAYFASGEATDAERWVSDTVYMAYNDYLEQGVETGLPGALLLITFYGTLLWTAYRRRNRTALMLTAAAVVMSGINFFYATIQPWIVLLSAGSINEGLRTKTITKNENNNQNDNEDEKHNDNENENEKERTGIGRRTGSVLFSLGLLLLLGWQPRLLWSQYQLGQLTRQAEKGEPIDRQEAETLGKSISTSEAYWTFMYRQYASRKEYEKALQSIEQAKRYTSVPSVYFYAFDCLDRLGRAEDGIREVETIRRMSPLNLTAKSILMQWYDRQGDTLAAQGMAREILSTPVKVKNARSEAIRRGAKKMCRE